MSTFDLAREHSLPAYVLQDEEIRVRKDLDGSIESSECHVSL